jgi:MinD-like ATPase involved in chromosome partitioning or flagellar assembly
LATILAVQSFKGGTGKSTVSANLAVTLARLGKRVAVVDLDLEGPGLHVIFGISDGEIRATINDVLHSQVPISEAVLDLTPRLRIDSGCLLFCPAGHRLEEILKIVDTGFNLSRFKAILSSLASEYRLDYLLIDSHPGIEKDTIISMAVCDVVVLLSRVDHQDMFGSGVMNEVAGQLRKPVVLILNMIPSSVGDKESKKIGEKIANLFNLQVLTALPFNSDVFENLSRGVFVLEHQKDPLTRRFTELAERMIGVIDRAVESGESFGEGSSSQPVS